MNYLAQSAESEAGDLERDIRWRLDRAQADLAFAEQMYHLCMSTPVLTEDGAFVEPDCDAEARQVEECQAEVSRLEGFLGRLADALSAFEHSASQVHYLETDTIPKAKDYLQGRVKALESFDRDGLSATVEAVSGGSRSSQEVAAVVGTIINVLASSTMRARMNQMLAEYGEKQGVKVAKALGAERAGTGLHYGRHGVDVYGLRNTPKGKTLIIIEVKTTADPRKSGSRAEVMQLLKTDTAGLQQGSRAYAFNRIHRAAQQRNPTALRIRSLMAHGKIHQVQNFALRVNVATDALMLHRAFSNSRGNRVTRLKHRKW